MPAEKPIQFETQDQLPEIVMSQASSLWNATGAWRYIKPRYSDKVPPCNQGCPAGNDIENFLRLIDQGQYELAWQVIKEENPFPRICGRVCYHPCEKACNRAQLDQSVSINSLERFVGDHVANSLGVKKIREDSGKKIAVIGSGPAGLSAAYHCARFGHAVTVFEADDKAGGLLRYGIPEYRLPKKILDEEIAGVEKLGVKILCNTRVGKDIAWQDLVQKYDAVLVATGVHNSRLMGVENEEAQGVIAGLSFLKKVAKQDPIDLGLHTVVVGGGNTAIDAARCALRLGSQVTIYYYRSYHEIPAFEEEVAAAKQEGVVFEMLSRPSRVLIKNGRMTGVEMVRTTLGEPDDTGRRRPVNVSGSEFVVKASSVIVAIGEDPDFSFMPQDVPVQHKHIVVDALGSTEVAKVFAGGDVAITSHNVSAAIGSGKASAIAMDAFVRKQSVIDKTDKWMIGAYGAISASAYAATGLAHEKNRGIKSVVSFDEINLDYFEKSRRSEPCSLSVHEATKGFHEVYLGLADKNVRHEATRCLHCGVCTMCDNCYVYCPDVAVKHKGLEQWGYTIDYDYCKGCGVCVKECPRSAMVMEEEK